MIQLLTESISIALEAEFGEEYQIYDESVAQGLKEPCFFIQCLEASYNLYRGKRYYRAQQFCIQYLPKCQKDARSECEAAAERLYGALEYLTLHDDGTLLRGRRMRHKTVDEVLHFFVHYDFFVMKKLDSDLMETLDHSMQEKKES